MENGGFRGLMLQKRSTAPEPQSQITEVGKKKEMGTWGMKSHKRVQLNREPVAEKRTEFSSTGGVGEGAQQQQMTE